MNEQRHPQINFEISMLSHIKIFFQKKLLLRNKFFPVFTQRQKKKIKTTISNSLQSRCFSKHLFDH